MIDYTKFLYNEWQTGRIADVARKTKLPISELTGIARGVLPITEKVASTLDSWILDCHFGVDTGILRNKTSELDLAKAEVKRLQKLIRYLDRPYIQATELHIGELETELKTIRERVAYIKTEFDECWDKGLLSVDLRDAIYISLHTGDRKMAVRQDGDVVVCSVGDTDQEMGNKKKRIDLGEGPIEA